MAPRRLSPEERAAWQHLARSVRPLRVAAPSFKDEAASPPMEHGAAPKMDKSLTNVAPAKVIRPPRPILSEVLDGSWERRIQKGQLQPEMSIDLHGHSLALAHQRLERALTEAVARDVRVLLVIAGKARDRSSSADRPGRGAIRAEIGHWLENNALSHRIASIRNAHPRHGGAGALYVILRRKNRPVASFA